MFCFAHIALLTILNVLCLHSQHSQCSCFAWYRFLCVCYSTHKVSFRVLQHTKRTLRCVWFLFEKRKHMFVLCWIPNKQKTATNCCHASVLAPPPVPVRCTLARWPRAAAVAVCLRKMQRCRGAGARLWLVAALCVSKTHRTTRKSWPAFLTN